MNVGDLSANVVSKMANRADLAPFIPRWIGDSVLELTGSYPFEELRRTGVQTAFITGQHEYPESYFVTGEYSPGVSGVASMYYSGNPLNGTVVNTATPHGFQTGDVVAFRDMPEPFGILNNPVAPVAVMATLSPTAFAITILFPMSGTVVLNSGYVYNNDLTYVLAGVPKITQIVNWFVELDSTSHVGYNLKYRSPGVLEPMTRISGIPCRWTRVGSKLIIGFNPDRAYGTQIRYQIQHPFSKPVSAEDVIFMPEDWREIVEYAAAERGCVEKRMLDYASSYHNILYGDPEFQKSGGTKGAPGLIFKRVSQIERDMANNERQMAPVVQRY